MKKNKKTLKAKKSSKPVNNTKIDNKKAEVKKANSDKRKKERRERKENNIIDVKQSIDTLSKSLLSMGGVKKEKLSPEDKDRIKKKTEELREARKKQYEQRRLASLKRRLKRGEKSEEEIKKSLEELKKEIAEQKRYDIIMLFNPNDKAAINTALTKAKVSATFISDDYLLIKDTDAHILDKVRGIPIKANIWPYKASKTALKPVKDKKPTTNTTDIKKAAKVARKASNIKRFEAQHTRKLMRDNAKKSITKNLKELMKKKFGKVSRKDVENGNFINKKVA